MTRATEPPADGVLAAIGRLAGFFDLTRPAGAAPPLRLLVEEPDQLDERIFATRRAIAARTGTPVEAVEARAAASTLHLGLAARIASPALAAAVLFDAGLPMSLDDLRVRPADGGLSLEPADGPPVDLEAVIGDVLGRLVGAFRTGASVSAKVLWGNVAAAFAGAAAVLGALRPDQAAPARATVSALLDLPALTGCGGYDAAGFRRTSCCLYYRLPAGGLCGDCVLRPR